MIVETLYRSPNGDDWALERGADGMPTVVHRANPASGGAITRMLADEFVERGGGGPEVQAVRAALDRLRR